MYYVDITMRNTTAIANYEDLPTTMHMKVTVGRRSVTRVFYLAYARLDALLLREQSGTEYDYNEYWRYGDGTPLGLPCAYTDSNVDLCLSFARFPGGGAGENHKITQIKFDYPGTNNDELGNLFNGTFYQLNNEWIGPALPNNGHILAEKTTRSGYHLGSYEEYNIVIYTEDGHKYTQKFSLPTMCAFNTIYFREQDTHIIDEHGVLYGLFYQDHGNEFTFEFRHQYRQWSTTGETFINPSDSDKLQASDVKFYLCNASGEVTSETTDIEVYKMGYQDSSPYNAYCTVKLVNSRAAGTTYKIVITNSTLPEGEQYTYEDNYLANANIDPGL